MRMPKKMSDLLELAGMTEDDLPSTEEECQNEIDLAITAAAEIRSQISDEAAGLTSRSLSDHTWTYRARAAAKHAQAKVNALKRQKNTLINERLRQTVDERKANKKMNMEAQRLAIERQKIKAKTHIAHMEMDAVVALQAVRELLKAMPEPDRKPFYDAISEAQEKHRSARQ